MIRASFVMFLGDERRSYASNLKQSERKSAIELEYRRLLETFNVSPLHEAVGSEN